MTNRRLHSCVLITISHPFNLPMHRADVVATLSHVLEIAKLRALVEDHIRHTKSDLDPFRRVSFNRDVTLQVPSKDNRRLTISVADDSTPGSDVCVLSDADAGHVCGSVRCWPL